MMPFNILGMWFRGLLAVAILVGAFYCLKEGYRRSLVEEPVVISSDEERSRVDAARTAPDSGVPATRTVFRFVPEWNDANKYLGAGVLLLLWASLGRVLFALLARLALKSPTATRPSAPASFATEPDNDPKAARNGVASTITRPDGSVLRVEAYGKETGPAIVWCHGWGLDSTEWFYQKENLARHFRLIVWDEPGLGLSKKPSNNDYSLENFAANLAAVIEASGRNKVYLAGHSIGGMTILQFCQTFPDLLRAKVVGLILAHTTYRNPVRTTKMAGLFTAIEKPVLVPFLYATIFLWPLVWVMNWISYFNGSQHRSTHKSSFAGTETYGQLNFFARLQTHGRPDVLARGMLGMLAYDATRTLSQIPVPTLVVVGDKDTTTLPEAGRYIASQIPNARLETLAPARHLGLVEHHAWFDGLVTKFVGEAGLILP